MGKVFAREQAFIGLGNNRDLKILKGELYDDTDQVVLNHPDLFAPVAESTDARVAQLEQQIRDLLAERDTKPAPPAAKPAAAPKTARKTTAPAATTAETEIKGEVQ